MATKKILHEWTEGEIEKLIALWKTNSVEEIATSLGVQPKQVQYMASQIRKAAPKALPKKTSAQVRQRMITNVLSRSGLL